MEEKIKALEKELIKLEESRQDAHRAIERGFDFEVKSIRETLNDMGLNN